VRRRRGVSLLVFEPSQQWATSCHAREHEPLEPKASQSPVATCADHNPRYFQPRTGDSRRRRGQSTIDNQQGRRIERSRDRGIEWLSPKLVTGNRNPVTRGQRPRQSTMGWVGGIGAWPAMQGSVTRLGRLQSPGLESATCYLQRSLCELRRLHASRRATSVHRLPCRRARTSATTSQSVAE
jgi:hypothetical protein